MAGVSHAIQWFERLNLVAPLEWDALVQANFPFADHAYLSALEETGAVGEGSGWTPHHLASWRDNQLEGASFLYAKNHSHGEYIFDWAWAQAYEKHGVPYYPKLVSSVPFTPATGAKLLLSTSADRDRVASELIDRAKDKIGELAATSLHYLFLTPEEIPYFEAKEFLIRHSFQYRWTNHGYSTFEDFLSRLKPRKRKQILRERQQLRSLGIDVSIVRGSDLTTEHADIFHRFYLSTIHKMGAIAYLSPKFFQTIFHSMRDTIILFLAEEQGIPIAGALAFEKGQWLYGRNWGSTKEVRNLHFELCYYRPLEYVIERRLAVFDAGAQGEHKIARGFLPVLTHSAHWINHFHFRDAIARFIEEEKRGIQSYFDNLEPQLPYSTKFERSKPSMS